MGFGTKINQDNFKVAIKQFGQCEKQVDKELKSQMKLL